MLPGIALVYLFGTQYAMRIWLDPVKLISFALTPLDVNTAITAQNVQISGGQLGGSPAVAGAVLSATIRMAAPRMAVESIMGGFRVSRGKLQRQVQRRHEFEHFDRFGEIAEEARLDALVDIARHGVGR